MRNKIVKFCEDYLRVNDFNDYCHNGLQVEGDLEVEKIITGVSFSQKLIQKAIDENAQMIMVHHGIFGDQIGKLPQIKGVARERLKMLLENNINLVGFHLPLDAHEKIGNNIALCNLLGLKNLEKLNVGFMGELENKINFEDFLITVNEKLETKSVVIAAGSEKVKKVGIISGGSSPEYKLAKEKGCDTYICGDIRESVVREVEEAGMNLINAGHYNTEILGIKNLGELVAKEFGVEVKFIDVPCEI